MEPDDPEANIITSTLRDFTLDWLGVLQMDRYHLSAIGSGAHGRRELHNAVLPPSFPFLHPESSISTVFRWIQIVPNPTCYYQSEEKRHGYRITLGCEHDESGGYCWVISCGNFVLADVRSQLTAQTNSGWITTDIVLCALTLSVSRNETLRIVVLDHQDIWQGGTGALVSKQTLELRREEGDELVMVLGHRDILPTSWLR